MVLDNPTSYANFVTRFVVNLLIIFTKVFLPILVQKGIKKKYLLGTQYSCEPQRGYTPFECN